MEAHRFGLARTSDFKVFEIGSGQELQLVPPIVGSKIQISGTSQISYATTLVGILNTRPDLFELISDELRFVSQNCRVWDQVKNGAIGSRNRRIKLPSREDRQPS